MQKIYVLTYGANSHLFNLGQFPHAVISVHKTPLSAMAKGRAWLAKINDEQIASDLAARPAPRLERKRLREEKERMKREEWHHSDEEDVLEWVWRGMLNKVVGEMGVSVYVQEFEI